MPQPQSRDDQWERIYDILQARRGIYVVQEPASRRFVESLLRLSPHFYSWRLVPHEVGSWCSVASGSRAGRRKVSVRRSSISWRPTPFSIV